MGHFLTRSPLHLGASRASADTVQVNNREMWSDEMLGHMSVKTSFPVLSVVIDGFIWRTSMALKGLLGFEGVKVAQ